MVLDPTDDERHDPSDMGKNEKSGGKVGHIASKGLKVPSTLSTKEIKSLSGSVLTQRPDKPKSTDLEARR